MKKLPALAVLSLVAFQLSSQSRISIGAEVAWYPTISENQTMNDYQGLALPAGTQFALDTTYPAVSVRAFVDFTYGLVSVGYRTSVSSMNVQVSAEGASASRTEDFSLGNLTVRAIAKYPFGFGFASLSPMLGVEWSPCLSGKSAGVDFDSQTKDDYSDVSLLGGALLERPFTKQMAWRVGVIVGYVLTSRRGSRYYTGVQFVSSAGWFWEISTGITFVVGGTSMTQKQ